MTSWRIRLAVAKDAIALANCIDAAYAPFKATIASLPDVSGGIDADIRDNCVWVAIKDGQIVGGLVLILAQDTATLANVAVHPESGGNGIGRALIARAQAKAHEVGATEMRLTTHIDMPANVAFYQNLGWHECGRTGDKVAMTKAL